jgi:putative alpha-1,2-mannosidase
MLSAQTWKLHMKTSPIIALAFTVSLSTLTLAQGSGGAPAAPAAPAAAASASTDCAKPMARHDHGAEKGTPSPKAAAPCGAAAASKKTAKAKTGHDHAKIHKNQ